MADTDDLDHQAVVDDLVEDSVVTDAYPVGGLLSYESDAARRSRLIGQKIYGGSNPLLFGRRQPGDRLDRLAAISTA